MFRPYLLTCLPAGVFKLVLILALLLCLTPSARPSEDMPSLNRPVLFFEFLTFRSDDAHETYLEVFCQIPKEQLFYLDTATGFRGDYTLSLAVYDSLGKNVNQVTHRDSVVLVNLGQDKQAKPLVIQVPIFLAPGKYKIQSRFTDLNRSTEIQFSKDIYIPDYSGHDLHLSSLQLASSILPATAPSRLVKHNLKVVPIVHHMFGEQLQKLFVYFEIYNLHFRENEPQQRFRIDYKILDLLGAKIKHTSFLQQKPASSSSVALAIPFAGLSAGAYQLQVKIKDLESLNEAEQLAYFTVVKPNPYSKSIPNQNRRSCYETRHIISNVVGFESLVLRKQSRIGPGQPGQIGLLQAESIEELVL